ncbi:hypothetical protein [uncultured Gemmiger sp.]|uniref:hypothetical protein n=1 Tax=uncultured Gemmiger sp. TaxID=1623490 RepID=UPI0025EC77E8|nr:hypothetical protein [uncultured Gemmiger sp.]
MARSPTAFDQKVSKKAIFSFLCNKGTASSIFLVLPAGKTDSESRESGKKGGATGENFIFREKRYGRK